MINFKTNKEFVSNITESALERGLIKNKLIQQDKWSLADLGFLEEEQVITGVRHLHFNKFHLPWLKLLTKLTVKERLKLGQSISSISQTECCLNQLDKFLIQNNCLSPIEINEAILNEFISTNDKSTRIKVLNFSTQLWKKEGWINIHFIAPKRQHRIPKIMTIPEEVLYQFYQNINLLPEPLERLFRLQIALGCRIQELLRLPNSCLKIESQRWFMLRWIAKRKKWEYIQVHTKVAELIQKQQYFINQEFGPDSTFDKLFSKLSVSSREGAITNNKTSRFKCKPIYVPKILSRQNVERWLLAFSDEVGLEDKNGKTFRLTSHMFRRTKASIMAYSQTEDEYIAAVLGHASLDMLPHYRRHSPEQMERETNRRGFVDMYGQITLLASQHHRSQRLNDLMKVSTPLGECHRPSLLGDCQHRYACLNCNHHRVTLDDKDELERDRQRLRQDLKQAETANATRRITEIRSLLEVIDNRLNGLDNLQQVKDE